MKKITENITLYWWNFGRRKLDFSGPINEFLKEKGFKISTISHPKDKNLKGLRFKVGISNHTIVFDSFYDKPDRAAFAAISLFLTLLGDKATMQTSNQFKRINWV